MTYKEFKHRFEAEGISYMDKTLSNYYAFIKSTPTSPLGYTELHHILPRSLFPDFEKDPLNIIKLRAEDHLKAHYYLALALPNYHTVQVAFYLMGNISRYAANVKKAELPMYAKAYATGRELSIQQSRVRLRNKLLVKYPNDPSIFQVDKADPRWILHEVVPAATGSMHTKGFLWRWDEEGRHFLPPNSPHADQLSICPPNGYQHPTKGKKVAYTKKEGKRTFVNSESDISDNLTMKYPLIHPTKGTKFKRTNPPPTRGKVACYSSDTPTKQYFVNPNDPRLNSGELIKGIPDYIKDKKKNFIPQNKGKVATHTSNGVVVYVDANDSRISSGEVIIGTPNGVSTKGKLRVFDSKGNQIYVLPEDTRLITGELTKSKSGYQHHLKGTLGVYDKQGRAYRVSPDDIRLLNNELLPYKPWNLVPDKVKIRVYSILNGKEFRVRKCDSRCNDPKFTLIPPKLWGIFNITAKF
jgi:hypothetical protein